MDALGKNKKSLKIHELKIGMVIAEKVYFGDIVLINKGVVVTDTIINRLKEKFILDNIEVFSEEDGTIDYVMLQKEKTVEEIENTFKELTSNIQGVFENIFNKGMEDFNEVLAFAKKIEDELRSSRTIIKDIVLKGSSNDPIFRHSVNVAALSAMLGKWLGFSEEKIILLTSSAILHDYGKTQISKELLENVGESNPKDYKEIMEHPIIGYKMVKDIENIDSSVKEGILCHHERLDGSGYPYGIKENKINAFAKIIAIADTFDEANSMRKYKNAVGPFEALGLVQEGSFGKLDYEYCKVFLEHTINFYISENALLGDGSIARIIQIDNNDVERPLLLNDSGFIDMKKQKDILITKLI